MTQSIKEREQARTAADTEQSDREFIAARQLRKGDQPNDRSRCAVCGCRFEDHRGGSDEMPDAVRHKCPPVERRGYPLPFPRTTVAEGMTRDYTDYWCRIDAYWSAETVFKA